MENLQEEYLIVKSLLEKYTPYTNGVERALELLKRQQNEIIHLHKQLLESRSEIEVLNAIQRDGY